MAKEDVLLRQASRAYKQGDKHTAARLLRELLAHNPQHAIAWYGLAMCTDDPAERRLYLEKALELQPELKAAQKQLQRLEGEHRSLARGSESRFWKGFAWVVFILAICTCVLLVDTAYRLAQETRFGFQSTATYQAQKRVKQQLLATHRAQSQATATAKYQATATYEACVVEFYDQMLLLLSRFFRQQSIAENTPRLLLAEQIARLEDIRTEAWNMPSKKCRPRIHARLMDYMDKTIAAYNAFLGDKDEESMILLLASWKALADLDDEVIRDGKRGGLVALFRQKGYFYWEGLDDPKWKEKLYEQ